MKRRYVLLIELLVLIGIGTWAVLSMVHHGPRPAGSVDLKVQLRGAKDRALLFRDQDGDIRYRIEMLDGSTETLTAEEFARRLYADQARRSWPETVLNISSPVGFAWVGLGLLGQVLFTGRMVVQWLVSEKKKESTVPVSFWWMSLIGSTMLLLYFLWRKDPIGLLGQAFGWFIYVRNLWLIYSRADDAAAVAPAAEDDPGP